VNRQHSPSRLMLRHTGPLPTVVCPMPGVRARMSAMGGKGAWKTFLSRFSQLPRPTPQFQGGTTCQNGWWSQVVPVVPAICA
jgi:hypothetical protein